MTTSASQIQRIVIADFVQALRGQWENTRHTYRTEQFLENPPTTKLPLLIFHLASKLHGTEY